MFVCFSFICLSLSFLFFLFSFHSVLFLLFVLFPLITFLYFKFILYSDLFSLCSHFLVPASFSSSKFLFSFVLNYGFSVSSFVRYFSFCDFSSISLTYFVSVPSSCLSFCFLFSVFFHQCLLLLQGFVIIFTDTLIVHIFMQ